MATPADSTSKNDMGQTSGAASMAAGSDASAADRATIEQLRRENESQRRLIEELNAVIMR